MLFTIMPIAIDRHNGPRGKFGATGSRIARHRIARSGNIPVAATALSANSK